MELDQLKNIWDKEDVSQTPEISTEKQREIHQPLEKIRKNMRMEFWSSLMAFVLIVLYFIFSVDDFKLRSYGIILTFSAVIVTAFYYYQFFLLYKELADQEFTTREMLKDLKTQFDLNKQYYISYYIAFVPIIVASYILIFQSTSSYEKYSELVFITILSLTVIAGLTSLYFVGKWWFKKYYGKYIKQIEVLIHDLE